MAANDNGDPTQDYYSGQSAKPASGPSWLNGGTLNPDGSITMPGGYVIPLPKGYSRNPDTGALTANAGTVVNPNQVVGGGPGVGLAAPAGDVTPPVDNNNGGGGGNGGDGGNGGGGLFNPGLYAPFQGQPPSYQNAVLPNFPQPPKPPPFYYKDFTAPTLDEASQQPGYQFGLQQGEQALQQSRAAQGLLRTGGTLKDILDYGRNAATQNYGNVLNQDLGIYNTNRAGAVQTYNTNYQTQYQDQYAPQLLQWQTEAQNAQHNTDSMNNRAWQSYLDTENVFYRNQDSPFSKYLSLAQLGAANA